jgi:hypothetical protein
MSDQSPKSPPLPTYTKEEVASILTRALDRSHEGGRISHDELLETAREIGVSTLEIEASIAEEVKRRAERMERDELVRAEAQRQAVRRFVQVAATYGVASVAALVLAWGLAGGASALRVVWVVVAGGVALGVYAARTFARKAPPPPVVAPPPMRIEVRDGKMRATGSSEGLPRAAPDEDRRPREARR